MAIKRSLQLTADSSKLKNKKILITAGPTWVPIDDLRVISNIASGKTGILLAERLQRLGAKVTLLIGPVSAYCINKEIKVVHFKFFDELKNKITRELRKKKYDAVIHSSAVSDFAPVHKFKGKIDSHKGISLKLKPLPKIIRDIKYFAPQSMLVMFKLESGVSDNILIKRAKVAQNKAKAELIVANRLNPYRAFVIDRKGNIFPANSRNDLARKLIKGIQSLCL